MPADVTSASPAPRRRCVVYDSSPSTPSPTTRLSGSTPWRCASARRRARDLGSTYFHTSLDACCIADIARGDGPNVNSLAPSRTANGRPRDRSISSGATNGTIDGRTCTIGVNRGPVMKERRATRTREGGIGLVGRRRACGLRVCVGRNVQPFLVGASRDAFRPDCYYVICVGLQYSTSRSKNALLLRLRSSRINGKRPRRGSALSSASAIASSGLNLPRADVGGRAHADEPSAAQGREAGGRVRRARSARLPLRRRRLSPRLARAAGGPPRGP